MILKYPMLLVFTIYMHYLLPIVTPLFLIVFTLSFSPAGLFNFGPFTYSGLWQIVSAFTGPIYFQFCNLVASEANHSFCQYIKRWRKISITKIVLAPEILEK